MFIVATAFDYHWLKTFAWPSTRSSSACWSLTLAIGNGVGGAVALGRARPVHVPVQRARQDPDDRRARATTWSREDGKLDSLRTHPRRVPPRRAAARPRDAAARPRDLARVRRRSSPGCCSCPARACVADGPDGLDHRAVPIVWTYILRDYQKQRLLSFLDPAPDIQGAGYQLYQSQIAVGSGGWFGKGLTNGTQAQGELPARPDHRLRVRDPGRGARASSAAMVVFALFFAADLARPRRRAGGRATRSGRCSRRAWPR